VIPLLRGGALGGRAVHVDVHPARVVAMGVDVDIERAVTATPAVGVSTTYPAAPVAPVVVGAGSSVRRNASPSPAIDWSTAVSAAPARSTSSIR
jgi:hypothetical protein